jgi:DNA adenine methylase
MKYMGSKARLVKHILPIILADRTDDQYYVEPFGGGANSICEVKGKRIYNDANKYLSAFFQEALYSNFEPPKDIDRDLYNWARDENKLPETEFEALVGYVGICGSYGGRWFDGGYAGVTTTKQGKVRNYPKEAYENVMKQLPKLKGCKFTSGDYKDLLIPDNSIVYCDPPYKGTKEYKSAINSGFCHEEFYRWCVNLVKEKGCIVFLSEYNAPEDIFACVWEKEVSSSLRSNAVISGSKKSVEKLFKIKL